VVFMDARLSGASARVVAEEAGIPIVRLDLQGATADCQNVWRASALEEQPRESQTIIGHNPDSSAHPLFLCLTPVARRQVLVWEVQLYIFPFSSTYSPPFGLAV
jgi:hypothetical protein